MRSFIRIVGSMNTTGCEIFIEKHGDPSLNIWVIIFFASIYSTLFILGTVGNISVIILTARNSKLQSVQNLFILNLAASDLAMCLFSVPITPITNIYKNWIFGRGMCHSLPWIQGISVFVANFSLAAIAIDRYYMILTPHSPIRKKIARSSMFLLWIMAMVFTLPYAMYMDLVEADGFCGYFCTEIWSDPSIQMMYTTFVFIVQYLTPGTIMFFCYYKIFEQLKSRTRAKIQKFNERSLILVASAGIMSVVGHQIPGPDILEQMRKKTELVAKARRNTVLLVSMVVLFGVAWLPHNLVSMLVDIKEDIAFDRNDVDWIYLINLITHSIAMVSIVANPVLYGLLNPEFVNIVKKTCSEWKISIRKVSARRLEAQSSNSTFL